MYVLNLNQYLKVEDSGFPLSCKAVKRLFQIKKGLFDLPNIVFSPFRGWKWLALSLISLPSLSSVIHPHLQYKNTWLKCFMVCVMEWSGFNTRVRRPQNTDNSTKRGHKCYLIKSNNDADKLLTHLMLRWTWIHCHLKRRGFPKSLTSSSSVLTLPPSTVHLLQALAGRPCSWILPDTSSLTTSSH